MTQPDPTTDLHMITLCHSGNGKHFTEVTIDYRGADGHAKTDSDDIIPAYPGFDGQNLDADGLYRLEHACQERPSLPTTTTTRLSTTTTVTTLPTTSTTVKPATTTTTTGPTTTQTTVTTLPTTETTEWQHEATTTTTRLTPTSTGVTTTLARKTDGTTLSTVSTVPPATNPTSTTGTTTATTVASPTTSHESLPVTGTSPEGLLVAACLLVMAGALFIKRGKR